MTPSSAHELRRQLERIAGHVQDLEAACIKDAASKKQRQSRRGQLPRLVEENKFSRLDAAPGHALPPPYAFMNHAKVVVVGLGGLGSTIAQNLAQSGVRFIRCMDSGLGVVEEADLGSCLGVEHLGERRSEAVARALSSAPDASGMSSSFMAFDGDSMDQLVQVITGLPATAAGGREEGEGTVVHVASIETLAFLGYLDATDPTVGVADIVICCLDDTPSGRAGTLTRSMVNTACLYAGVTLFDVRMTGSPDVHFTMVIPGVTACLQCYKEASQQTQQGGCGDGGGLAAVILKPNARHLCGGGSRVRKGAKGAKGAKARASEEAKSAAPAAPPPVIFTFDNDGSRYEDGNNTHTGSSERGEEGDESQLLLLQAMLPSTQGNPKLSTKQVMWSK